MRKAFTAEETAAGAASELPAVARILVVEDNILLREILRRVLVLHHYTVDGAEDGRAALALYQKNRYDVVLLDMIMPQLDGVETICALHELDRGARLVAMSGGGERIGSDLCMGWAHHLGVRWLLRKPFTQEQLLTTLRSALAEAC